MKLIEKKCPNCGASLSFDKHDTDVTCEYCKKSYVIQRDEIKIENNENSKTDNIEVHYNLVSFKKRNKAVFLFVYIVAIIFIISIISSFLIFSRVLFGMFESSNVHTTTNNNEIKKDIYVTEFSQIDEKSLEIFHEESLKTLNSRKDSNYKGITTGSWTYCGMYLLNKKNGNDNMLYDVFKRTVTTSEATFEVYGAVKYRTLKLSEDNIVLNDFNGQFIAPMYMIGYGFVYGYEDNNTLYNRELRELTGDYKVIATEGLYLEKKQQS